MPVDATDVVAYTTAGGSLVAGIIALFKARNDRKEGIEDHEISTAEVADKKIAQILDAYSQLLKDQGTALDNDREAIQELQNDVISLKAHRKELEERIVTLTGEKTVLQSHIETLVDHINKQLGPPPPVLPGINGL